MGDYKELVILIAEDDAGHAELIKEGLKESGICNRMIRFRDGQEAWDFLSEELNIKKQNYLLLLDINMPRMSGIEVLKRIKEEETLKNIPVIMLTTTDDPREVEQCYTLGCNVYITKPVDFLKLSETLHRLGLFLQIVKI
ncbi:MAG TPA: response regulator [Thermotogota bacterium]|nr:response regulator [Thermotogota bacterium]HPJ89456.1 response regulator [Thermotogota bacterium]HPR96356.1 response regulator [Thermotogota bacterium]